MTSLHPPSFHRNDFSTCSTHFFNYGAKYQPFFALRAILYTRACARGRRPAPAPAPCTHVHTIACYGVVQCLPVKSPTIYSRNLRREKNGRLVSCTPPSTVERFGEKISAEACSGKEIAGLLKKMMMMMMMMKNMMTRKSRNCI